MEDIKVELRRNLKENFNFSEETLTWESIKQCLYGPEKGYLRQGKKPNMKYVKDFCNKLYERQREFQGQNFKFTIERN